MFSVEAEFKVHEIDVLNLEFPADIPDFIQETIQAFLPETGAIHAQIAKAAAVRAPSGTFQNGKTFPHELITVLIHLQQMVGWAGELI